MSLSPAVSSTVWGVSILSVVGTAAFLIVKGAKSIPPCTVSFTKTNAAWESIKNSYYAAWGESDKEVGDSLLENTDKTKEFCDSVSKFLGSESRIDSGTINSIKENWNMLNGNGT